MRLLRFAALTGVIPRGCAPMRRFVRSFPSPVLPRSAWALAVLLVAPVALKGQSTPARLDADLEQVRAQYHLPGITAMVVKDGRIVAVGAAGVRRYGQPTPITPEDPVNIASCTKWMTATLAARLVDQGVITWDTRVRDIFSNYATFHPSFSDVTLAEFLTHRSGIEDYSTWQAKHWAEFVALPGSASTLRRWTVDTALRDAPQVPRGTYLYSNEGYTVAAAMLEFKTGKTWEALMAEYVFTPLGMGSARLGITYEQETSPTALPQNIVGHNLQSTAAQPVPIAPPSPAIALRFSASLGPGGDVVCTLRDWAKFLQLHVRAAKGYLNPATEERLCRPNGSEAYAMGVGSVDRVWARPGNALNHNGDIWGEDSVFWVAPGRNLIVALFTNTASVGQFSLQALDVVAGIAINRYANATAASDLPVLDEAVADNPTVTSRTVPVGGSATLAFTSQAVAPALQWRHNGTNLAGATTSSLNIVSATPADTGLYSALATQSAGHARVALGILGLTSSAKVTGAGSEVGADIRHPNGNVFDQVLLEGGAAAMTADAGQVLRISYIDLNHDIVQIEFSGAGTLSVVLDGSSGPALPVNYNQAVSYMKGHAGIVVSGADETTNLSVFSVGRANAVNAALFRSDVTYDGIADLAFVAITSANGKFGGLRTANARFWATTGFTGVYAPGVQFTGPVFIGDVGGMELASGGIVIGSANEVTITGGNLRQPNGRATQVRGITRLRFANGSTSHGNTLTAQANDTRLEEAGVDVTNAIVVNAAP
jgi:CubicO group peptidase (beta-lactamase class C family)